MPFVVECVQKMIKALHAKGNLIKSSIKYSLTEQ